MRAVARSDKSAALELLGGVDLSVTRLRTEAQSDPTLSPLVEMMDNAEYWLSFDMGDYFEPLLTGCPSPL